MTMKFILTTLFMSVLIASCSKEYYCIDLQIMPAFINYLPSEIDTFVIRKFKANDKFQTLIDTFVVIYGYYGLYRTSNDTTSVLITDGKNGIRAGYDWQLFIPAKNKTILISDIISEKKKGIGNWGICSLDPGPSCTNDIFSVKVNNQIINFSNSDTASNYICITN